MQNKFHSPVNPTNWRRSIPYSLVNTSWALEVSVQIVIHSPVKPVMFKLNVGVFGGTVMASFLYGPNYTHRLNRRVAWRDHRFNRRMQKSSISLFTNGYFKGVGYLYPLQGSHLVLLTPWSIHTYHTRFSKNNGKPNALIICAPRSQLHTYDDKNVYHKANVINE